MFWGTEPATGFGVAWLLGALPVSLPLVPLWDLTAITVKITELEMNGDIAEEVVTLPHASQPAHVTVHAGWFRHRLAHIRREQFAAITSGSDLWNQRAQLFPYLRFCDETEDHLKEVLHGSEMLQPILNRLFELDEYCHAWHDGPFDPNKLPCKTTTESQVTLDKFASERTFTYVGQKWLFSWHVRMTPGAWRLYFMPDTQQRLFYVGYIGKKMSTTLYKV